MKIIKCEKGSVIVELALLIPLLLAITFGFIFFNNVVRTDIILQVAAREGAREYSFTDNVTKARSKAELQLELGNIDKSNVEINAYSNKNEKIIIVSKIMSYYIPFFGEHEVNLEKGAVFYYEM